MVVTEILMININWYIGSTFVRLLPKIPSGELIHNKVILPCIVTHFLWEMETLEKINFNFLESQLNKDVFRMTNFYLVELEQDEMFQSTSMGTCRISLLELNREWEFLYLPSTDIKAIVN